MFIKSSFARNLSLRIVLVSSVLLALVIMVVAMVQLVLATKHCATEIAIQMRGSVDKIETEFSEVKALADNASLLVDWIPATPKSYKTVLTTMVQSNPHVYQMAINLPVSDSKRSGMYCPFVQRIPESGETEFKMLDLNNKDYAPVYSQIKSLAESNPWCGPYWDTLCEEYEVSYLASSVNSRQEQVFVETVFTLDWLSEYLESIKPYEGSEAFIIANDTLFVCGTDSLMQETMKDVILGAGDTLDVRNGLAFNSNIVVKADKDFIFKIDGENKFVVGSAVLNNGWTMCILSPAEEVFGDIIVTVKNMFYGLLFCILLIFLFCTRIIYKKSRPLVHFAELSSSIAQGDFDAELPKIKGNDEVKLLRDSFENMQVSLKHYIKDLKETTAENERMESELSIASRIQAQVLRKEFPSDEHFSLYATMHPAKEVGGDLYDFVKKGDKLYFCIGDVSGKGVPAALVMTTTTMMFRHICSTSDRPLDEIVSLVNNSIADGNENGFFVTFFAACLDLNTGELKFCNAGHNNMILITADGKASFIKAVPNLVCGISQDFKFVEETAAIESGSRLLLYTDGINEAMNIDNEQYGDDRLLEFAAATGKTVDDRQFVDGLIASVKDFTRDAEQSDDITAMSLTLK